MIFTILQPAVVHQLSCACGKKTMNYESEFVKQNSHNFKFVNKAKQYRNILCICDKFPSMQVALTAFCATKLCGLCVRKLPGGSSAAQPMQTPSLSALVAGRS